MISRTPDQAIKTTDEALTSELDERARRVWAATEARSLGHGGVTTVARATGLAESPIRLGNKALTRVPHARDAPRRMRRHGAGRKPRTAQDQQLLQVVDALVEPTARGDPLSPLRWTCKSTRRLATELGQQGHHVSHTTGGQLLKALNDRLPGTRNTREGTSHPDRQAPFESSHAQVKEVQHRGQPVVSVETKTKALVGNFANGGRADQPQGRPEPVRVHDLLDQRLGQALPYGVDDMTQHCGWVSVGVDHETAECAVATVPQWWQRMGQAMYPKAQHVLMTADGGGSNGRRARLWKVAWQRLSDTTGLDVGVCHVPPATSTWNTSEHRLLCHITEHWRGRPLVSHEVSVHLMAHTTTETGRRVEAALDPTSDPTGPKVSDDERAHVNVYPAAFHGDDWNDVIKPSRKTQ